MWNNNNNIKINRIIMKRIISLLCCNVFINSDWTINHCWVFYRPMMQFWHEFASSRRNLRKMCLAELLYCSLYITSHASLFFKDCSTFWHWHSTMNSTQSSRVITRGRLHFHSFSLINEFIIYCWIYNYHCFIIGLYTRVINEARIVLRNVKVKNKWWWTQVWRYASFSGTDARAGKLRGSAL